MYVIIMQWSKENMAKKKPRVVSSPIKHSLSKENTTPIDKTEYLPGLYDTSNPSLAKKHYMTYVMRPSNSEYNDEYGRYYLSKSNKDEFFQTQNDTNHYSTTQKRYILDEHPSYKFLIEDCLSMLFGTQMPGNKGSWAGKDILQGLGCFLDYLASDYANEEIKGIQDIDEQTQYNFYDYADMKPLGQIELMYSARFLSFVSKVTGNFKSQYRAQQYTEGTPAYSTPIIYKLDYYARESIKDSIALYNTYFEALEEAKEFGELFTLENLLKTRYSEANKTRGQFTASLDGLIKRKYDINAKVWVDKRNGGFYYRPKRMQQQHMDLIKISEKGVDITPNTLPLKLWWFLKLYPDWPHNQMNPEYDGLFNKLHHKFAQSIELTLSELNICFKPSANVIYPLLLLLQIRTGKNTQPLTDLMIERSCDGKYSLGLRLQDGGRKIFSVKSRTNSEDYIFLHTDSEIDYYIETFLEWFGPAIYEHSSHRNFFQGFSMRTQEGIFFTGSRRANGSQNFLEKYEIFDHQTKERLTSINHMRLRPSFVGAAYLMGLKEYESQHLLRHKQDSTQHLHYSNHTESKEQKLRRLALAQRKIIELFKGQIIKIGEKDLQLGKGVLSDCADAKNPTHEQKPEIKDDEACSDWTMCLLCEKSRVIKELHGSVIIAMKLHLNELQENMPTREWEKEYREIYDSILSVLEFFADKEKESFAKDAHRHRALCEAALFMRRKRKTPKEIKDAHEIA